MTDSRNYRQAKRSTETRALHIYDAVMQGIDAAWFYRGYTVTVYLEVDKIVVEARYCSKTIKARFDGEKLVWEDKVQGLETELNNKEYIYMFKELISELA